MSAATSTLRFQVHYQLTDDEQLRSSRHEVSPAVLNKEAQLIQRLHEMRHPLDLNSLFVTPRLPSRNADWRIWKGSMSKRAGGEMRFLLQVERISENDLVIIAHYRGENHDEYERNVLTRLRTNGFTPATPQVIGEQTTPADRATIRWVRAPGNLLPPMAVPYVTEGEAVPRSLPRQEVLQALKSNSVTVINTPDGLVTVTPTSNGCWHISAADVDERPRREFPIQAVEDEEAWNLLREIAESPETDPCLILSPREREFLSMFQNSGKLPVLVHGSAGSGKTTLLSMSLAAVVDGAQSNSAPDPLFVTYSTRLRDLARKRLISALIIQRGWSRDRAEGTARRVCRTFSEVVDEILQDSLETDPDIHRAAKLAGDEWTSFLKWWNGGKSQSAFMRGGASPGEHFRVLNTFFFGYLPVDRSPTDDEWWNLEERRCACEHLYDVSADDLESSLRVWNEYRGHIPKTGTVADRSIRALEICLSDPETFCKWGHIIVDEIQDFSDHDILLIIGLSQFSSLDSLPLFMAGDEMQSISPSGFTFAGCRELLQNTVSAMGFELTAPPTVERMTDNFRNLRRIAELTVSSQRLLTRVDRAKHVSNPHLHRIHEGDGTVERVSTLRPLHSSVASALGSPSMAVVVPCRWEDREHFVRQSLTEILGSTMDLDYRNFLTVEQCKGLEYSTVVLCGFASAYSRDQQEGRPRWILNALIVAVSRARNRVVLLDHPNAPNDLFDDLREEGYPVESIIEIAMLESSDTEQVEVLLSRLRNLVEGSDELVRSEGDITAELTSLLSNLQEVIDRGQLTRQKVSQAARAKNACSAWLIFLTNETLPNWTALHEFGTGRLWERVIDDAIAKRSAGALENLFPITTRNLADESRLFQAACVLAVASTLPEDAPARIARLVGHLDSLPSAGDQQWISGLIKKSPMAAALLSEVHKTIKSTSHGWGRPEVMRSAELLELIDPADWTAGLLRVKHLMSETAQAQAELRNWTTRLPEAEYSELELEILLVGYGLTWIDDTAARQEILSVFQGTNSPDPDIFKCMALPSVQKCAERQLDSLYLAMRQRATPQSPFNKRSLDLVKAAINNIVLREARESVEALTLTRKAIQIALNPKEASK